MEVFMGLKERLAVVEAKLGIESPQEEIGFFWDDGEDNPRTGVLTGKEDGRYEKNNDCWWDHYVPLTSEEIKRFEAAGVTFSEEE
jgi:hypothetical protein